MKSIPRLPLFLFLFALSLASLKARTPSEVNNFLKQANIPELKADRISVTKALDLVNQLGQLQQHKVAFVVSVAQKADMTVISLDLKNVSAYEAIQTICNLSGLNFTFKKDQVLIF